MQNFTEFIKREIIKLPLKGNNECKAFLSAFIRTSGKVISRNDFYGFEISTENEYTAEFLTDLIEEEFGLRLMVSNAHFVIMSGKDKLTFECVGSDAQKLLSDLYIIDFDGQLRYVTLNIDKRLISSKACRSAYLNGAFLGGGSCTLPDSDSIKSTGYHFEIIFQNIPIAEELYSMLADYEIVTKIVPRKENAVLYIKSKDLISDMLYVMGVTRSLKKLNKIIEENEALNNMNRAANCSASNIDKSITASVNQIKAIELLNSSGRVLDDKLQIVAEERLKYRDISMQELADRLNLTKSCVNHRMRKIIAIASTLG